MMQKRKIQRYKPVNDDGIDYMKELQSDGMSVGSIAEIIFDKYRISLGHSSIRNYLSKVRQKVMKRGAKVIRKVEVDERV
jgi:hypothetical protein